jgi:hypothetical protein
MLKIEIKLVEVLFEDDCANCGTKQTGGLAVPIVDLITNGTPTCENCGEDLIVEELCNINTAS